MIRFLEVNEYEKAYDFVCDQLDNTYSSVLSFLKSKLNDFKYLGLFEEDKLIGLNIFEESDMRIILLIIDNNYQRKGYGKQLLDYFIKYVSELHISKVSINALNTAFDFYKKYGFEENGETIEAGAISFIPMEYLVGKENLGKKVEVIVDREYGSFHPHLPDVTYELNFGYINDHNQDGEFQDAWIVGVDYPLEKFTGIVIGIVYHKDDEKSRWLVAPVGYEINHEDIINQIGFEEQYYDTNIVWTK